MGSMVPLIVKDKNQNEQARFESLLHYKPDTKTIGLLEQYHDMWLKTPALFDGHLTSSQLAVLDPWKRIASAQLDTKQDLV